MAEESGARLVVLTALPGGVPGTTSNIPGYQAFVQGFAGNLQYSKKEEINNWCVLAAGRREPLIVTIGQVDGNKLRGPGGLKENI